MRTTIDNSAPILADSKRIRQKNGGTLAELVNALPANGLKRRCPEGLIWTSQPTLARVDPEDKEAVYALLDDHGA